MENNLLRQLIMLSKRLIYAFLIQLFFCTVILANTGNAQRKNIEKVKISMNLQEKPLAQFFEEVESKTDFKFTYTDNFIDLNHPVTVEENNTSLYDVLVAVSIQTHLNFVQVNENIHVKPVTGTKRNPVEVAQQQEVTVSGKVVDDTGEPLPGATITVLGTMTGTITDIDGNYSITVPEGATLVFSFIGYEPMRVAVDNRSQIDVTLKTDISSLDEVVVIGYGTINKSDLTGSVSSIKSEELLDRPSVNVGQALSGKLPGVEVYGNSGRPDGQIKIRIRGNNSITASNEPLYVIDGVIGVADINLLNPNNIESLEVLKDASATAIYGARGANGVILITTKRGIISDAAIISYDGYTSFGVMAKNQNLELLNSTEWWQVYNTGYDNIQKYDPIGFAKGKFKRASPQNLPLLFDNEGNPLHDTDWEDETYRTAISQNHQISLRGGNEKTIFSAYLGYTRQEALMDKNYLNRYNGQFNIDSKLRDWLKFGVNFSLNFNKGNDLYNNYSLKRLSQEALPIIPVKYPNGNWGSNRDFPGAVQDTPLRYLEELSNQTTNTQVISDFYLNFKINKNLDFKSTFAVDGRYRKNNYYNGKNLIQFNGKNRGGIARINIENQFYWQNENYFNWSQKINENNNLNLMLGLSWQQRSSELLGAEHQNFIDDFYQWHNLGAGTVNQPSSSSDWRWSLNSYFARANYTIKNKYLFTATGRYDGSSKFGGNNKYAFFPSLAFGWRVSEENFLKDNSIIEDLKIRTSFGKTGNQDIANYAYSQNLGSSNVIFMDQFYSAIYRSSFGNPDLKWETTTQFDGGLDVSFLNGRINLTLDYYQKITSDLLLNAPLPYTSGLDFAIQNIGSVQNKGWELALNTYNINSKDYSWISNISFAANKNKIKKLGKNNEDIFPTNHATGQMQILRVDQSVGSFWGLTRLGTWNSEELDEAAKFNRLPGDLKYADLNQDGIIDANDNSIIGQSLPDWTMGISNSFSYKNVDLLIDIRIVRGIDVMNAGTHTREDRSGVANGSKTILNAWTPSNQNTMVAELRYMRTYYDSYPDTHWLQDGSFTRLQNLLIAYNFNSALLSKIKLQKLRVYASGQNLFLLTNYKGYDPEVSTHSSEFGQGIDDFGEPRARTFAIGLNLEF
jgi:TonB-linked SusC/RagA family outer membrane protein